MNPYEWNKVERYTLHKESTCPSLKFDFEISNVPDTHN